MRARQGPALFVLVCRTSLSAAPKSSSFDFADFAVKTFSFIFLWNPKRVSDPPGLPGRYRRAGASHVRTHPSGEVPASSAEHPGRVVVVVTVVVVIGGGGRGVLALHTGKYFFVG